MKRIILFLLLSISLSFCRKNSIENTLEKDASASNISKPKGLYSSSFGNELALENSQVRGSLVRVKWSDLEPTPGNYDFSKIEKARTTLASKDLNWSLGIIAGGDSPAWLMDDIGAEYFKIVNVHGSEKRIPKIWDLRVNERLALLAKALSVRYTEDDKLVLVYVPQMTSNGIEGHFNGVADSKLVEAGLTPKNWINSVKETAKIFAEAFKTKAIAVEVHDIMRDTSIPNQIITDLWNDTSLNQRVGAGVWWLSGKTTYQSNLLDVLLEYPGDIYAQAIGRSDQKERFGGNEYTNIFEQARKLNIQYLELWEYEFVNNTFPAEFLNFNNYVDGSFN